MATWPGRLISKPMNTDVDYYSHQENTTKKMFHENNYSEYEYKISIKTEIVVLTTTKKKTIPKKKSVLK